VNIDDSLRYPVGRPGPAVAGTPALRAEGIADLAAMPELLRAAVKDLSDAQLDTPYREGGWTVRQVVHHFADSHANAFIRFKLALTEDWPTIKPYNEKAWAELPDGKTLAVEGSLRFIEELHARWVFLLKAMSEADFERGFLHPENNSRQNLDRALAIYAWHSRHHVAHITGLRARNGW
jgi:uncharacterized damage-inducible protein DinB